MKHLSVSILVVVLIGFGTSAAACEACKKLGSGATSCWSGQIVGYQWCYGGFGDPCNTGDPCIIIDEQSIEAGTTTEEVCSNPIAGCTMRGDGTPSGGFMLQPDTTFPAGQSRKQT
jgi:hypothetical protein